VATRVLVVAVGRPGIATRFVMGLLLLKHTYGLSDEGVRVLGL
jgi:hypothetical protein